VLPKLKRLRRGNQRRFLRCLQFLYLHQFLTLPFPVAFALRATACMFALLFIMPAHPLAIPAVIGGGISLALIATGGNKKWLSSTSFQSP